MSTLVQIKLISNLKNDLDNALKDDALIYRTGLICQ
jgi:hypothetical protein